jgi:hypothetical protein
LTVSAGAANYSTIDPNEEATPYLYINQETSNNISQVLRGASTKKQQMKAQPAMLPGLPNI